MSRTNLDETYEPASGRGPRDYMIRLEEVTKVYGETTAVNKLSFEVAEGDICVLIGPSGCGKTTTLRMINRLVEPTSGSISVNGRDTRDIRPEQLRLSIGYAIQSVGLFPHMTVAQNIAVVPRLLNWDKTRIQKRVEELLSLVSMSVDAYSNKYPFELSGGEAQRIGVARALAADPPVLLMDEPFGAVDPLTRERLQSQFLRIQQSLKKTVILVTHDLDEAIRMADRIAIMQSGELIQLDRPEIVLSKPANRFVRDFVGADRALKRLSRIPIRKVIRPAASVGLEATVEKAIEGMERRRWIWVVDDSQRLIGWLDRIDLEENYSVREAAHVTNPGDISVEETATLREALSRMLGLGFEFVPVVDEGAKLVGELALEDVERTTSEGEE